jgi:hypothetical protein
MNRAPAFIFAALALAPVAAHADTIMAGDLMYTDLYQWQGQYGTPTWRQILALYDCTEQFSFYLWNVPQPPLPVVSDPPPESPVVEYTTPPTTDLSPPCVIDCGGDPPPPCMDCGPPPPVVSAPEPATWLLFLTGFACCYAPIAMSALRRRFVTVSQWRGRA